MAEVPNHDGYEEKSTPQLTFSPTTQGQKKTFDNPHDLDRRNQHEELLCENEIKSFGEILAKIAERFSEKTSISIRRSEAIYVHDKQDEISNAFQIDAELVKDGKGVIILKRVFYCHNPSQEWRVFRHEMYIVPEERGKGIGTEILQKEEKEYRKNGISQMQLKAMPPVGIYNNASQGFDFRNEVDKDSANAALVSYLIQHPLNADEDIFLGGTIVNPMKRRLTAPELSRLKVKNKQGRERFFPSTRLINSPENRREVDEWFGSFCSEELALYKEIGAILRTRFFGNDVLLQLKLRQNDQKKWDEYISWWVETLLKYFTRKYLPELREEEIHLTREVLRGKQLREKLYETMKMVDQSVLSYHENYSLGKALFLDLDQERPIHAWDGVKFLD